MLKIKLQFCIWNSTEKNKIKIIILVYDWNKRLIILRIVKLTFLISLQETTPSWNKLQGP